MSSTPAVGQMLGHYRILEQVGAGGMGVVFRAYDERLERDVAIKVLPPGLLQDDTRRKALRKEALTISRLSHPSIAHVYDFDSQNGTEFLVMEFIRGQSLAEMLKAGPLSEIQVISYGQQIAAALSDAHRAGVLHRDMKPSNLMLDSRGQVKVLDFGLAQLLCTADIETTQSMGTAFCGTLPYMAPEQLRGDSRDARSDVYSLGVTLYELATAQKPFDNPHPAVLIDEMRHRAPTKPQDIRPGLSLNFQRVVLHCLEKDPKNRFQSASEVADALAALAANSSPAIPSPSWVPGAHSVVVAIIIIGLIAVAAISLRFRAQRGTSVAVERELAIFPITDEPGSSDTAFGNGLLETLASRLAQLGTRHALEVVPASELRRFKVSTLEDAKQQFGATLGLRVTVQRAGDSIRVNYGLIDAQLHREIAGDTLTAPAADPFGLQDKVADSVTQALDLQLQPDERKVLTAHATDQPAAYDYYLQGRGYLQDFYKLENVDSAITEFNLSVERDNRYALAYAGLGEAFWRKQQLTGQLQWVGKAESACRRAVELRPEDAAGHFCLGLVFRGTGHYEQAAEQYKTAVELDPSDDRSFTGLGFAYEKLGKTNLAEETLRHAISLRTHDWAAYNSLGEFYMNHGRYHDAEDMFSQVVALTPDSFAAYSNLGAAYVSEGDYSKAIPALQHSLRIRESVETLSNLATCYFELRRYTDAARTYEKAISLNKDNYEVWGNLGDAYYWAPGERPKAKVAYGKAVELAHERLKVNPRDAALLSYIAQDYAMVGDESDAVSYISRALRISPKSPDVLATAGLIYHQLGDDQKTFSYLDAAVANGYAANSLRDTPNFDDLRDTPQFRKLIGMPHPQSKGEKL